MPALTIAQTQHRIHALGLTCRWMPAYSEYRVDYYPYDRRFVAGDYGSKYFTSDAQDAIDTARVMARRES